MLCFVIRIAWLYELLIHSPTGAAVMKKTGYIYTLKEDKEFQTRVFNTEFENQWMKLKIDGSLIVKGSHANGYAWNC
jgi:hypothetical protein